MMRALLVLGINCAVVIAVLVEAHRRPRPTATTPPRTDRRGWYEAL